MPSQSQGPSGPGSLVFSVNSSDPDQNQSSGQIQASVDPSTLICSPDDPTDGGMSATPVTTHPALVSPPHGLDEIKKFYGDIKIANGKIIAPPKWEENNLVLVKNLPAGVAKLYIHHAIYQPL